MSTIEDEARAEAERVLPKTGLSKTEREIAVESFVQGYLAASRREPSGASANVSNRPKDDISSDEMSVSEPSDTDEREWEYGCQSRAHVMARRDHGAVVLLDKEWADIHGFDCPWPAIVRRRKAGPWEVVPDGDNR